MVVRIAGVTLPQNKRIAIALTYVYGIGNPRALKIIAEAKVDPNTRTQHLNEAQINALRTIIEKGGYAIEGDLRREISTNIRRLKEIGSFRGSRHAKNLPSRGQRTRTNSRSVRGNVRRTMGSGRKPSAQKT